eukprot:gene10963-19799_t
MAKAARCQSNPFLSDACQRHWDKILSFRAKRRVFAESKFRTNAAVFEKDLAESLLHRVREFALSLEFLDSIAACSLFQNLTEIMVSDSNQDFRNRSLHLFRFSLKRFDTPSRSILLRKLLRSIKHSGVCSLIVQCIKDEVLQLDSKLSDQSLVKKITPSFLELTYLSFDPILQHDCDIVMEAERFIAALNLLRFLLLRSAENNDKFNILANFHKMEERYLSVLQKKTEDSYAEISCHLNESRNEIKSSTSERKEDASTDCSFSLKHLELSGNIEETGNSITNFLTGNRKRTRACSYTIQERMSPFGLCLSLLADRLPTGRQRIIQRMY